MEKKKEFPIDFDRFTGDLNSKYRLLIADQSGNSYAVELQKIKEFAGAVTPGEGFYPYPISGEIDPTTGHLILLMNDLSTIDFGYIGVNIGDTLTKSEIEALISNLVDSAPASLNTLHELANALGDDPNFATTIINLISQKVSQVAGYSLTKNDLTDILKSNYDSAYDHSRSTHAPANAQANVVEVIKVNGIALTPNEKKEVNIAWLDENGNLVIPGNIHATGNIIADGDVSAFGSSAGVGGSGLIQTVYGYNSLGGSFNDAVLTETFNAYTINRLAGRISTLENNPSITSQNIISALGFTPYNSTNPNGYITASSIPASLPASDVYAWAKQSAKPTYSWGEILSRPTLLSQFSNDLGNYGNWITASALSGLIPYTGGSSDVSLGSHSITVKSISIDGFVIEKDSSGNLKFNGSIFATGDVSAFGSSIGSGGSGLIQTVYGYSSLGSSFDSANLTDTFNAFAINRLAGRISTLETNPTLNYGSVISALGFTPWYSSSHPTTHSGYGITDTPWTSVGYLTGITGSQVTSALGFTPYNTTNPNGYIAGINSSMVINALGYTPLANRTFGSAANNNSGDFLAYNATAVDSTKWVGVGNGFSQGTSNWGGLNGILGIHTNGYAYRYAATDVKSYLGLGSIASSNTGDFIQNNNASAQSANIWINGIIRVDKNIAGLILNRDSTSYYNGIRYTTGGDYKWFVGLRENLLSNNYIIYSENGFDALTLNQSSGAATFASSIEATQVTIVKSTPYVSFYQSGIQEWKVGQLNSGSNLLSFYANGQPVPNVLSLNASNGMATFSNSITGGGELYLKPYLPSALSGGGSPYYGTNITLASDLGSNQGAARIWGRYGGGYSGGSNTHLSFEIASNTQSYNSDPRLLTYVERMRLTSDGNLVIGFSSDQGYRLAVNGNICASGNYTSNGEVTAYSTSDFRLKTAITAISNPFDLINGIRPVSYYWNDIAKGLNANKTNLIQYGVVAQELANVRPEWVYDMYSGKYKGVDYIQMIPVLLACIQEQQKQIEMLQNK